jgi:hypothetical protein
MRHCTICPLGHNSTRNISTPVALVGCRRMTTIASIGAAVWFYAVLIAPLSGQSLSNAGTIRGSVLDPTGAAEIGRAHV